MIRRLLPVMLAAVPVACTPAASDPDDGITIEISRESEHSIRAVFTPGEDDMQFIAGCVPAYYITDRQEFMEQILKDTGNSGFRICSGNSEEVFDTLQAGISYTVFAFGTLEDSGNELYSEPYSSQWLMPDLSFELVLQDASNTTLTVKCTPTDTDVHYIYYHATAGEYADTYGNSDEKLILEMIETCRKDLEEYNGMGMGFTFWDFCDSGIKERTFKNLEEGTSHYIYAFGLSQDGYALSGVSKEMFDTL